MGSRGFKFRSVFRRFEGRTQCHSRCSFEALGCSDLGNFLGGSWVVISGVIIGVTMVITPIKGLITLFIATHEPPSKGFQVQNLGFRVSSRGALQPHRMFYGKGLGFRVYGLRFRVFTGVRSSEESAVSPFRPLFIVVLQ